MYRAKLAEDYDGIGQYVLVALSGGTTGSAYKARIAAGDFGGDRTFPKGTPVYIRSYRGGVEVFLGNIPRGCIITWPETLEGTWGEVHGAPTDPDYPNWMTVGCNPGDAFYRKGNEAVLSSDGEAGIIDLTDQATIFNPDFSEPWPWYHTGGPVEEYSVGDTLFELLIKLKIEFPVASAFVRPQLDLYICGDDRLGDAGTVGDTFWVTLGSHRVPDSINNPTFFQLQAGFFSNAAMGYPALNSGPGSVAVEWDSGSTDYWDQDIWLRWQLERNEQGYVDNKATVWVDGQDEPAEPQAYRTQIDDTNWRGGRTLILGPYASFLNQSGFAFHPTIYRFYSIEDTQSKLCLLADDRELDDCNG